MKSRLALVVLVSAICSSNGFAHHSRANFDMTKSLSLTATVKQFRYGNPHSYVFAEALDAEGNPVEWIVELGSVPNLTRMKMQADSLQPGDKIGMVGNPDRDAGKHIMFLDSITKSDGVRFSMSDVLGAGRTSAPAITSGAKDLAGIWRIQRTIEEILNATHDVPDLALTAKGKAVLASYDPNENPYFFCQMQGVPRNIDMVYPTIIKREANTLVFSYELSSLTRTVYLDGAVPATMPVPSVTGYSVGHMENQTLVVETSNFSDEKWGLIAGLDSSSEKQVVERYTLGDDGKSMHVSVVTTDPEYLTAPMRSEYTWTYSPETSITPYVECDLESASLHLQEN